MLSCESTAIPPTWPIRQSFGNGFGQLVSTTKLGADVPAGALDAQRVAPSFSIAPASRSAPAAAPSVLASASSGGPAQPALSMADPSTTTVPTKRAFDMASPQRRAIRLGSSVDCCALRRQPSQDASDAAGPARELMP